jgi:hypothetical protein
MYFEETGVCEKTEAEASEEQHEYSKLFTTK